MPYYEANIGDHNNIIEAGERRGFRAVFLHESLLELSAHTQNFIPRAKLGFVACSRIIFIHVADCFGLKTILCSLHSHMCLIFLHGGVVEEGSL